MQLGDEIKEKYLPEEILVMLEGRIRVQGLKAVLKARKESTVGTRDVLLPKVIKLLKGGPITRTEKFTPEIVTLAEWVHGKFDLEEFLEGSTNLEVKYGNNRSPYSSNLVRIESNKGLIVRVANGMLADKAFPNVDQCVQVFTMLNPDHSMDNQKKAEWIYDCLVSSSLFALPCFRLFLSLVASKMRLVIVIFARALLALPWIQSILRLGKI